LEQGLRSVVLRDWSSQLLADSSGAPSLAPHYCQVPATGTGIDETAIREWGFLERVSTGLDLLEYGAGGRPFLETAEPLV
jgi:streptomycin 6-kinase